MVGRLKLNLPRTYGDLFALLCMLGAVHFIVIFELIVILPEIATSIFTTSGSIYFTLGLFLWFNVMSDIMLCMCTDPTSGSQILPSILKPGWRFCSVCEANAPPRSWHCFTCNVCILKRDHHCVFLGSCIGHANQRYFIALLFHLSVGAVYCNYLNMDYIWELLGGYNLQTILTMIFPLLAWMFGYAGAFTFSVCFVSSSCLLGCLLLGAYFGYNVMHVYYGQTITEGVKNVRKYDCGMRQNFVSSFGERWQIALLCSWIPSPLPGNGLEFPTRLQQENIKDL